MNRRLAILVTFLLLVSCATTPEPTCSVEPEIFCEPFQVMQQEMPKTEQEKLLAIKPQEFWRLHFGLGMGVRNTFDLWGDNQFTEFFRKNGVDHPDSMSLPFIGGFVEYLRGGPVDMTRVIRVYRVPPPPSPSELKNGPNNSLKRTNQSLRD